MMTSFSALAFSASFLLLSGCGSSTGALASGDWYHRNPDPSVPVLWKIEGWDIEGLSTAEGADYLDELEKDVLLHMNMARTDPAGYAEDFIEPRLQYFSGNLYREPGRPVLITVEGPDALIECIEDMEGTQPMEPLTPSIGLTMAAFEHALDLSSTGLTGHVGSDGSLFSQRIERHGRWLATIGEVIAYGPETGREIVLGLLIDDGVSDNSHRSNLLNPGFRLTGLAVEEHETYGNVCVIEFAGDFVYGTNPEENSF